MQFIQGHANDVFKKKNSSEQVAVKFLILVSTLIEELQLIQENVAICQIARRMNQDPDMPEIVNNFSIMEVSVILDKFTVVCLSFLVWSPRLLLFSFINLWNCLKLFCNMV